ncbi:MAG: hypothetical protein WBO68_05260 [Pyrinomonadaceae bacterium]|nr:hypothetical protein [Acidobacteriota bacterium]
MMFERAVIHGCLVRVYGSGVLIVGEPGVGKTSICIELDRLGHDFIADDAVELEYRGSKVFGCTPEATAGKMALLGDKIVPMPPLAAEVDRYSSVLIEIVIELLSDRPSISEMTVNESIRFVQRETIAVIDISAAARTLESLVLTKLAKGIGIRAYG